MQMAIIICYYFMCMMNIKNISYKYCIQVILCKFQTDISSLIDGNVLRWNDVFCQS